MRSARLSSTVVLATVVACHTAPRPLAPHEIARAHLLRIEDTRRDEPAYMDSLLRAGDVRERADAALSAGRIGARNHIPALRVAAEDADTAVSSNALFALGMLKDSNAVELAARALARARPQAREAAWLLGEVGDAGRKTLIAGLENKALGSDAHAALLIAATRLKPVPASAVEPYLSSGDSALVWRAAYALARGRSITSARRMYAHATSPFAAVREQVASMAGKGIAGDSLQAVALAALVPLLADTSAHVRINAVRSVASFGVSNRTAVLAALRDPDLNVRLMAAQSLGTVLDSSASSWTAAFAVDTHYTIQRAIADGAAARRILAITDAGWSGSSDWRRRAAAAELSIRVERATPSASYDRWLMDSDGRVRAAVAGALAGVPDSIGNRGQRRATFKRLLSDPDVDVRATALRSLTRGATIDELDAALVEYRFSLGDVDTDARLAFWRLADSALARNRQLPVATEASLAALARPAEINEANAAGRIPRFSAWRDTVVAARPPSFYEERVRETLGRAPVAIVETDVGTMEIRLFATEAPLTVYNMVSLAKRGYFNGQTWHRVVPNFVVQAGAPRANGNGGPGYSIRDEINRRRYLRGILGMALSGPNTGGSQFFITHSPQPHLDGGYTIFGEVIAGFDVLDRILQGDRIVSISVR